MPEDGGEVKKVLEKPKKMAGRKKVAKRKKFKPVKERGLYHKSISASAADIAECLFSDDEVRLLNNSSTLFVSWRRLTLSFAFFLGEG